MKPLKRVLILTASPRKNSNSTILAQKAAEGVNAAGGEADVVPIGTMKIAPCNACDACRTSPEAGCVINDEMQPLYKKIEEAQSILFATPVYWFSVSAQMKCFIDRTYATYNDSKYAFTEKDVGVILTYEDKDVFSAGGVNALRSFQDTFAYVKANQMGTVHGSAGKAGDVQSNDKLLQEAYELGRKIVGPK